MSDPKHDMTPSRTAAIREGLARSSARAVLGMGGRVEIAATIERLPYLTNRRENIGCSASSPVEPSVSE